MNEQQRTVMELAALMEQPAQQEPVAWKPIETAPKDVMVLVCLPRQMNLVVRAWYNSIHNFWQTDYEGEGGITRPMYFHEGDLWHPIPPLYTAPQPAQQEPVAWVCYGSSDSEMHDIDFEQKDVDALPVGTMLYTTPPQRTWVGLTDEEIDYYIVHRCGVATKKNLVELIRLCEIKLKEKNT